ncbi:hypothetical protein [Ideonella sp.]|uniref:hypothetical protein n=1 Tax=Ideonella sp. TaxID=1929293 RepID=UPI00351B3287
MNPDISAAQALSVMQSGFGMGIGFGVLLAVLLLVMFSPLWRAANQVLEVRTDLFVAKQRARMRAQVSEEVGKHLFELGWVDTVTGPPNA